ncbi:hypothetical protein V4D30_09765 [Thermodesulfovibrio sp. 3907-1M]|uniref:Uncharacterized protein n=1 Tax=Thermodesulfovibrio autotrophicus TaxID=3118333 RepID=A0AAU8GVX1_9BACT
MRFYVIWKYLREKADEERVKQLLEKFIGEIEDERNNFKVTSRAEEILSGKAFKKLCKP